MWGHPYYLSLDEPEPMRRNPIPPPEYNNPNWCPRWCSQQPPMYWKGFCTAAGIALVLLIFMLGVAHAFEARVRELEASKQLELPLILNLIQHRYRPLPRHPTSTLDRYY